MSANRNIFFIVVAVFLFMTPALADSSALKTPEEEYTIGNQYRYHTPPDYAAAYNWYLKAAEDHHAGAQHNLGYFYENGLGVTKDPEQALVWYQKAAEQGYANSQYNLGNIYSNGWGVPQDYVKALYWYQKAAEQNQPEAMNNLGRLYNNGWGTEQDHEEALKWYTRAANAGHALAATNIGAMYQAGEGVHQDYGVAAEWYTKAAVTGEPNAQSLLGYAYAHGQGMEKDYLKAGEWYGKAAENDDEGAKEYLARLQKACPTDKRIPFLKINEEHVKACLISAGAGDPPSLHYSGQIYFWGQGMPRNKKLGIELTRKAAQKGYKPAQADLAIMSAVTTDKPVKGNEQ